MGQAMSNVVLHRARFNELERRILQGEQLPDEITKVTESVSGNMYYREMTIPKNGIITGAIYKFDHIEIMIRGDIDILSADGSVKNYKGHNVIEAKAGKRQAGYAREDTVWATINRVPDIPIDEMIGFCTAKNYADFLAYHRGIDLQDFQQFLKDMKMSQEELDKIVQIDDLVEMPEGHDHLYLSDSLVEGRGVFSKREFFEGDLVGPARQGENRTILGRYTNHALFPNTHMIMIDGVLHVEALRGISIGSELTLNYRDVLRFRESRGDLCQQE